MNSTSPRVLFVTCSLAGATSRSRHVATRLVQGFIKLDPRTTVVERDLSPAAIPHLTHEEVVAWRIPPELRTIEQQAALTLSDTLIGEVEAADIIVLAVPMYNFMIPSTLKAWIDRVVRAGRTFRYVRGEPVGLVDSRKKVYAVSSRGGLYRDLAGSQNRDCQIPYLLTVLSFIGLTDVSVVTIEGQSRDVSIAAPELARASAHVDALLRGSAAELENATVAGAIERADNA